MRNALSKRKNAAQSNRQRSDGLQQNALIRQSSTSVRVLLCEALPPKETATMFLPCIRFTARSRRNKKVKST